jgi:hypothetical protein
MPANIKEVFDNFPTSIKKSKKKTNQSPVINYEDIVQNTSEVVPHQTHVYSSYNPKAKVHKPKKPRVTNYIALPQEDIYSYKYMTETPEYSNVYKKMEEQVKLITQQEMKKYINDNKVIKEKVVYLKDKKQEMSQEIMELISFLATGVFIILLLDKLN